MPAKLKSLGDRKAGKGHLYLTQHFLPAAVAVDVSLALGTSNTGCKLLLLDSSVQSCTGARS